MSSEFVDRNHLWSRLSGALDRHEAAGHTVASPTLLVDLDAFDANAADLARRAAGTPIRVVSTSLRVPALITRALGRPGFHGVLASSLAEALWLYEMEISDDILVGYPDVDTASLRRLVSSPAAAAAITLMVDDVAHLDVVDAIRSSRAVPVQVAIDVDAGVRISGQHVGPRRSPLHDVDDVVHMASTIARRDGFRLVGAMTYEGHLAGVPDEVPRRRAASVVVRQLKRASLTQLRMRRREIAEALGGFDLRFWNAGGSGSIEVNATDPVVTEVAAGSGLLGPTLLDHFQSFSPRPAAFAGVPVVRRPSTQVAVVAGTGFVASGPAGADRTPTPWAPPGLHLSGLEGAGEVQTPLTGHTAGLLAIGDRVWFRPAKSGELFSHGTEALLLSGDDVVDTVPTYRGVGLAFG